MAANGTPNRIFLPEKQDFPTFTNVQESVRRGARLYNNIIPHYFQKVQERDA